MLHVVMWKWHQPGFRSPYTAEHVNVMASMLNRFMPKVPYRLICVTDDDAGIDPSIYAHPLWKDHNNIHNASGVHLPSCYRRLKLFDPATQLDMGIEKGDRIMWIDLDAVIVGSLQAVATRPERFVGWAVRGTRHLRVFNGSMLMFSQGDFKEIWHDFHAETSPAIANKNGYFGSDQSWLSYKLSKRHDCAGWGYPAVLSYPRECKRRPTPPRNASVIFFHGREKPWHDDVQKGAQWIRKFWH